MGGMCRFSNESLVRGEGACRQRRNAIVEHRGCVFNQEKKQSGGVLLCSAGRARMSSDGENSLQGLRLSPFIALPDFISWFLSAKLLFSVITGCSWRSICLRWAEERLRLSSTDISSASFLCVTFHFSFLSCFYL